MTTEGQHTILIIVYSRIKLIKQWTHQIIKLTCLLNLLKKIIQYSCIIHDKLLTYHKNQFNKFHFFKCCNFECFAYNHTYFPPTIFKFDLQTGSLLLGHAQLLWWSFGKVLFSINTKIDSGKLLVLANLW